MLDTITAPDIVIFFKQCITSFFPPFPGVTTRSERFRLTLSDFGVVTSYIVSLSDEGISKRIKQ